ncbi:MAG TPA: tetratricopeptide repeat protein [Oceanipulchritudo sp.]|nr:tetratricopeptide repeat protein [Oceanipulchritudo sp.]
MSVYRIGITILLLSSCSLFLHGNEEGKTAEGVEEAESEVTSPVHGEEGRAPWGSAGPLEKAAFFHEQKDYRLAEKTYVEFLESPVPMEEKKEALLALAEVYFDMGMLAKAVNTLENCLSTYPKIEERPKVLFRLGQVYRELGLKDEAIAVFYRVLNSIVVTGEENLERYMGLARLSQFEIARIHFNFEDFERAYLLFDRIDLLKLEPADRETVLYYKAVSSLKANGHEQALKLLNEFVDEFPKSEYLPEMYYLKAEVLQRLDRLEASADELVRLLEAVGPPGDTSSTQWNFWRKQAGNRLANRFYAEGDYRFAIRIYQGMVGLEDDPAWQLPIIYQIGLAAENADLLERALESYSYIIQEMESLPDGASYPEDLGTILENARWRQDLVGWRIDLRERRSEVAVDKGPESSDTTGT